MKDKIKMIWVLGIMAFFANGDNYAAAPLLIDIGNDLGITVSSAAISVTSYMLAFGVFTLIFGPLSDRFGKVKIINIAAFGTAIFSMLCAATFNLPSLVFFRAMNGAFGAGIFPVTLALVGGNFNNEQRPKAIGKIMSFMFLGAATAAVIGGTLSYIGSWRLVYFFYGFCEFILAIIIFKTLERDHPVVKKLNIFSVYKTALTNFRFIRLVSLLLILGFCIFGCFTFSGKLVSQVTGFNTLIVGLILSLFGIGTVLGNKIAPKIKAKINNLLIILGGVLGAVSLYTLSVTHNVVLLCLGFLGFGMAFIFIQPSLVSTAQDKLAHMRGTAMSVTSFNLFVGGAIGTTVNGILIKTHDITQIFFNGAFMILAVGIIAAIFVSRSDMRKRQAGNPEIAG